MIMKLHAFFLSIKHVKEHIIIILVLMPPVCWYVYTKNKKYSTS